VTFAVCFFIYYIRKIKGRKIRCLHRKSWKKHGFLLALGQFFMIYEKSCKKSKIILQNPRKTVYKTFHYEYN